MPFVPVPSASCLRMGIGDNPCGYWTCTCGWPFLGLDFPVAASVAARAADCSSRKKFEWGLTLVVAESTPAALVLDATDKSGVGVGGRVKVGYWRTFCERE